MQAMAGTDYDGIENGHSFAKVGSASRRNIPAACCRDLFPTHSRTTRRRNPIGQL
jgi:hypothetical protein